MDDGRTLITGQSLHEVNETRSRLLAVLVAATGAAILIVTGLGWFLVQVGLRPLRRVEADAREITDEDLPSRRVPGADANGYHAFAGQLAGGLYGIANKIDPGEPYAANGYEAKDLARIPWNIVDAIELWRNSSIARECFGEEVHHHILNAAEQEWRAFNRHVTDWELRRYFERV